MELLKVRETLEARLQQAAAIAAAEAAASTTATAPASPCISPELERGDDVHNVGKTRQLTDENRRLVEEVSALRLQMKEMAETMVTATGAGERKGGVLGRKKSPPTPHDIGAENDCDQGDVDDDFGGMLPVDVGESGPEVTDIRSSLRPIVSSSSSTTTEEAGLELLSTKRRLDDTETCSSGGRIDPSGVIRDDHDSNKNETNRNSAVSFGILGKGGVGVGSDGSAIASSPQLPHANVSVVPLDDGRDIEDNTANEKETNNNNDRVCISSNSSSENMDADNAAEVVRLVEAETARIMIELQANPSLAVRALAKARDEADAFATQARARWHDMVLMQQVATPKGSTASMPTTTHYNAGLSSG